MFLIVLLVGFEDTVNNFSYIGKKHIYAICMKNFEIPTMKNENKSNYRKFLRWIIKMKTKCCPKNSQHINTFTPTLTRVLIVDDVFATQRIVCILVNEN